MGEGQAAVEKEQRSSLPSLIADVFDRRVENYRKDRKLIRETYEQKFEKLLETIPRENRDTTAIKIQKVLVKIGGFFSEYGARFTDFVRNVVMWPMVRATRDFPKDKYYQIGLARAKAWGEFARDTTRTATAERMAYRNHFLPSAVVGAEIGTAAGALLSIPVAVGIGATEGAKVGLVAGAQGALLGATVGGAIGGAVSLALKFKDRIIGPPVLYYELFASNPASSWVRTGSSGPSVPGPGAGWQRA